MINPSIWTNRKFLRCNDFEKLLFIGLFSIADDYGKLWYDLLSIKASIFPCNNLTQDYLSNSIRNLHDLNLIISDEKVIKIHGWKNHQFVPKPQDSVIPEPKPNHYSLPTDRYGLSADKCGNDTVSTQYQEGNGTLTVNLGESNDTITINLDESNGSSKERNKERKKESSSVIPSDKELLTKETKTLLLENVSLFSNQEYNEINTLITEGKNLSASTKIYEKLENINSAAN
ncbi:MAG: hypothetical protein IPM32_14465 [Ignavibacteriae bacterium]|nr:hypothetical protein [Ignavibacteriota bacterium]